MCFIVYCKALPNCGSTLYSDSFTLYTKHPSYVNIEGYRSNVVNVVNAICADVAAWINSDVGGIGVSIPLVNYRI